MVGSIISYMEMFTEIQGFRRRLNPTSEQQEILQLFDLMLADADAAVLDHLDRLSTKYREWREGAGEVEMELSRQSAEMLAEVDVMQLIEDRLRQCFHE